MADQTAGARLITRYYCFLPAIGLGGALLALPAPWAPALLFLNQALFIGGARVALAPRDGPEARLRLPAQLIWQLAFGAGAMLFLGAPLIAAWPEWNAIGVSMLALAAIAFLGLSLCWWPAHGILMAHPAIGPGNPIGTALRGCRMARRLTAGDLKRTIDGLPVVAAALTLGAVPWALFYPGTGLQPAEWYLAAGAYLLLLSPWLSVFVFSEARKLVPSSDTAPGRGEDDGTTSGAATEPDPGARPMRPSLRYRNQDFEHPLMQAAADCDLNQLEQQSRLGADLDQVSEHGSVPLVAAVRSQKADRLATLDWLLEHGASIDQADAEANTPLHYACYLGDAQAARLLIDSGAGLEPDNADHLAPLAAASASGHWKVANLLIDRGAALNPDHGIPPLHAAAMLGRDDHGGVETLIARGAEVNFRGKLGRTALMGAAMKGNPMIAELLLKSGADVNARDDFGNTALMEAARSGANQVLERLSPWQPDTGYRDKPGRTALLVAVSSRRADPETIRLLLAMGADPHVRNREGREAGDLASAAGRWRVAKALGYEPVSARNLETGSPAAMQTPPRIENENDSVTIDITGFATAADADWARRQLQGRSRTRLHAATPVMAAAEARDAEAAEPASPPPRRVAADPDWPEPGEAAAAEPRVTEPDEDFEPTPPFELVPENLPVPATDQAIQPAPAAAEPAAAEPEADTVAESDTDAVAGPDTEPATEPDTDTASSAAPAAAEPVVAADGIAEAAPVADALEPETPIERLQDQEPPRAAVEDDSPAPGQDQAVAPDDGPEMPALDSIVDIESPDDEVPDQEQSAQPDDAPGSLAERQVGYQALIEAATGDDTDQMKVVMLSQDEMPEWWLAAAFLNSVAHGRLVAPRWLLDNGLSANASGESGQPLLNSVVQQSPTPVDTIELLLNRGARVAPNGRHLLWISGCADHEHGTEEELEPELEAQLAALVPRLAAGGAAVDVHDSLGRSPLHWAVRYRGVKYLGALLEAGCNANARDQGGNSVLMYAVETRRACQLGVIRALIKSGADPRRANDEGVSPMSRAMEAGDNTILKLLMLAAGETAPAKRAERRDSLLDAAAEGNLGRLKRLLAGRADVNQRDGNGCTPLLRAAGSGHSHIVTALLAAGADPELAADNGTTPLGAAVLAHQLEMVRLLHERGVPIDEPQQYGITPLMLAAARWHPRMARLLLRLGASIDGRDEADGTALMAAAQNAMFSSHVRKGEDTIKILLAGGADVNAVNDEGQSALMLVLGVRARETQSPDGAPLVNLVRLLIDAGADLDAQDFTGWSALHAAAAHGFLEPARDLLAAGASKRLRDINGLSPCDLAMDHAHDRLVDLFLEA